MTTWIGRTAGGGGLLTQFLDDVIGNLLANFLTNGFDFGVGEVAGADLLHHTINGANDAWIGDGLADAETVLQIHQHPRVESRRHRTHKLIRTSFQSAVDYQIDEKAADETGRQSRPRRTSNRHHPSGFLPFTLGSAQTDNCICLFLLLFFLSFFFVIASGV